MASLSAVRAGGAVIELFVKDLTRSTLRNAQRRFMTFGRTIARLSFAFVKLAAAATAASAAVASITTAAGVKRAADLVETINAFNMTFRDQADTVRKWAMDFADSMGRSRKETLESLTTFQAFGVGLGLSNKQAAIASKRIHQLAVDFASFRNLPDAEAVTRLLSGLAGEPEQLRRFGVNIGEAAVNLKLMELGLPRVQQGATELHKWIARLSIIEDTFGRQGALGDADRTSHEFINQLKRLRANIENAHIELGEKFLPVALEVVTAINRQFPVARQAVVDLFSSIFQNVQQVLPSLDQFRVLINNIGATVGLTMKQTEIHILDAVRSLAGGPLLDFLDKFANAWISVNAVMTGVADTIVTVAEAIVNAYREAAAAMLEVELKGLELNPISRMRENFAQRRRGLMEEIRSLRQNITFPRIGASRDEEIRNAAAGIRNALDPLLDKVDERTRTLLLEMQDLAMSMMSPGAAEDRSRFDIDTPIIDLLDFDRGVGSVLGALAGNAAFGSPQLLGFDFRGKFRDITRELTKQTDELRDLNNKVPGVGLGP